MKKKILILLCIIIVILSVIVCHYSKPKNTLQPEKETTSQKQENYNLIFVCSIPSNEYWVKCIEGMKEADKELGTTTKVVGSENAENFATEIVDYMKQAIEEKPDGIIAYSGIKELAPLINEAKEKGIPVLSIDSDAPETSRIAYVGTDGYNAGYNAGKKMVELIGENAKIGIMVTSKEAEKEMQVVNAFKEAIYDYNIEVVALEENDLDIDVTEEKVDKMITQHPDIKAIFGTGNNVTGAAHYKKDHNLDNLVLIGFDDTEENLKLVQEGIIETIIVQKIKETGYQSVSLMKEYLDKGALVQETYDVGTMFVTPENIGTYNIKESAINTKNKKVKVGYYKGNTEFQNGFDEKSRKSGYAYEYYQIIADIVGWNYEYIYGSRTEIMEKLEAGEVDIVAGVYKTDTLEEQMLFSEDDMGLSGLKQYFAINLQRKDLLDELNYAMEQLEATNPEYAASLLQKYYGRVAQQTLNSTEKEWIKNKKVLKVGYIKNNLPLSDEGKDGEPTGVVKDLIARLKKYMNIEIQAICFNSMDDIEKALTNKTIDAAFPVYSDQWLNESKGFRQTDAVISDRVMIIYKGEYSNDLTKKVALSKTQIGQKYYMDIYYPDSEITFYETKRDIFEAIEKGDENCILGCSSILQNALRENPEYNNFNIAYLDTSEEFGMTVRQEDGILISILNKAIRQIDKAAITSSMIKYSDTTNLYTIRQFVQRYAALFIIFLVSFVVFLVIVFMLYHRQTQRFKKEQAKTNKELEQAVETAKKASEAKTNFLSSMSHDIRTPMNAIIGMTTIANNNLNDKEKVADCLKKIDLSSHHLLTLINNILDISKIESGNLQLNPNVFSIKEKIHNILEIARADIEEKKINFIVDIEKIDYEMIYADEVRITQIFVNILGNAIKYTPEKGNILIHLSEELLEDKNNVRLTYIVKDDGIGMSKEYMKNMYNTFSRAEDSRTSKIQGTGLGLAIVKQMVEMMEGTIDCESELNKGTKFTITIDVPIRKIENSAIDGEVEEVSTVSDEEKRSILSEKNILIAEDNDLNWEIISEILDMYEISAERAENGKVCVDKLENSKPGTYDIVLMDVQMPVMDGREATREIRKSKNEYVKNIPIIAMTADAFAEDIKASLEAGMNGHVTKPIDIEKLFQEIKKVLK